MEELVAKGKNLKSHDPPQKKTFGKQKKCRNPYKNQLQVSD